MAGKRLEGFPGFISVGRGEEILKGGLKDGSVFWGQGCD